MYQKGEYVIYGNAGVCEIADITTMDMEGVPKDRLYYVLHPYYQREGKIYTPVDSLKVSMRKVLSQEEAMALIDDIPNIDTISFADDRQREVKYKECIKSCQCREWIKIIKSLYLRKKERMAEGKKITATDDRYLKLAEESLYSELAIPLGIPRSEMETFISNRIEAITV